MKDLFHQKTGHIFQTASQNECNKENNYGMGRKKHQGNNYQQAPKPIDGKIWAMKESPVYKSLHRDGTVYDFTDIPDDRVYEEVKKVLIKLHHDLQCSFNYTQLVLAGQHR